MVEQQLARDGWKLSEDGLEKCRDVAGKAANVQQLIKAAQNLDLKHVGKKVLPEGPHRMKDGKMDGPMILQIKKCQNISVASAKQNKPSGCGAGRCLRLTLTDGHQDCRALEVEPLKGLHVDLPPGTKVLLSGNIAIRSGFVQLTPQSCRVLGGCVEHLFNKWELTRSVAEQTMVRGTGEAGAPQFIPFDKAVKGGRALTTVPVTRSLPSTKGSSTSGSSKAANGSSTVDSGSGGTPASKTVAASSHRESSPAQSHDRQRGDAGRTGGGRGGNAAAARPRNDSAPQHRSSRGGRGGAGGHDGGAGRYEQSSSAAAIAAPEDGYGRRGRGGRGGGGGSDTGYGGRDNARRGGRDFRGHDDQQRQGDGDDEQRFDDAGPGRGRGRGRGGRDRVGRGGFSHRGEAGGDRDEDRRGGRRRRDDGDDEGGARAAPATLWDMMEASMSKKTAQSFKAPEPAVPATASPLPDLEHLSLYDTKKSTVSANGHQYKQTQSRSEPSARHGNGGGGSYSYHDNTAAQSHSGRQAEHTAVSQRRAGDGGSRAQHDQSERRTNTDAKRDDRTPAAAGKKTDDRRAPNQQTGKRTDAGRGLHQGDGKKADEGRKQQQQQGGQQGKDSRAELSAGKRNDDAKRSQGVNKSDGRGGQETDRSKADRKSSHTGGKSTGRQQEDPATVVVAAAANGQRSVSVSVATRKHAIPEQANDKYQEMIDKQNSRRDQAAQAAAREHGARPGKASAGQQRKDARQQPRAGNGHARAANGGAATTTGGGRRGDSGASGASQGGNADRSKSHTTQPGKDGNKPQQRRKAHATGTGSASKQHEAGPSQGPDTSYGVDSGTGAGNFSSHPPPSSALASALSQQRPSADKKTKVIPSKHVAAAAGTGHSVASSTTNSSLHAYAPGFDGLPADPAHASAPLGQQALHGASAAQGSQARGHPPPGLQSQQQHGQQQAQHVHTVTTGQRQAMHPATARYEQQLYQMQAMGASQQQHATAAQPTAYYAQQQQPHAYITQQPMQQGQAVHFAGHMSAPPGLPAAGASLTYSQDPTQNYGHQYQQHVSHGHGQAMQQNWMPGRQNY